VNHQLCATYILVQLWKATLADS